MLKVFQQFEKMEAEKVKEQERLEAERKEQEDRIL